MLSKPVPLWVQSLCDEYRGGFLVGGGGAPASSKVAGIDRGGGGTGGFVGIDSSAGTAYAATEHFEYGSDKDSI